MYVFICTDHKDFMFILCHFLCLQIDKLEEESSSFLHSVSGVAELDSIQVKVWLHHTYAKQLEVSCLWGRMMIIQCCAFHCHKHATLMPRQLQKDMKSNGCSKISMILRCQTLAVDTNVLELETGHYFSLKRCVAWSR